VIVAAILAVAVTAPAARSPQSDCREWTECRTLALEAAARNEYETFHDLAWRAVQLGPKQDAALLFLLARAQSLSGRPHDALVMLRRMAPGDVARAALEDPDFERVRRLREWPEVAALLSEPAAKTELPETPEKAEALEKAEPTPAAASPKAVEPRFSEALTFAAASFRPSALVYDAVSRRFIISDTDVSRLAVIDEFSHQIATLASGQSAGFGTVTALAIDPRVGDLWVASVDGSSGQDVPALHKLQLISGRVLKKFTSESTATRRFVDVAVAGDGTVYALQADGQVWRLKSDGGSLAPTHAETHSGYASLTAADRGVLYIAERDGIVRFPPDFAYLTAPDGVDLRGIALIRWSRGSLVALQRRADGSHQVIRIRLARDGRSVTKVDVLDPSVRTANPAAATIAGDVFYYLAETDGPELAIRRIDIR
jgi:hypothetical protein